MDCCSSLWTLSTVSAVCDFSGIISSAQSATEEPPATSSFCSAVPLSVFSSTMRGWNSTELIGTLDECILDAASSILPMDMRMVDEGGLFAKSVRIISVRAMLYYLAR